jgi:hypothetical protein
MNPNIQIESSVERHPLSYLIRYQTTNCSPLVPVSVQELQLLVAGLVSAARVVVPALSIQPESLPHHPSFHSTPEMVLTRLLVSE